MSEKVYTFSESDFRKFLHRLLEEREDGGLDDPKTVDRALKLAMKGGFSVPRAAAGAARVSYVAKPREHVEMSAVLTSEDDGLSLTRKGLI